MVKFAFILFVFQFSDKYWVKIWIGYSKDQDSGHYLDEEGKNPLIELTFAQDETSDEGMLDSK